MRYYCTEERHPYGGKGIFCLADTERSLKSLLSEYRGKVQLIYLDPPKSGSDTYSVRVSKGKRAMKLPLYSGQLTKKEYLAALKSVLLACRELLSKSGAIYLHTAEDYSAQCRLMMDEIFGEDNFQNEIIWCYKTGGRSLRAFPRRHDTILYYRKSKSVYFDIKAIGTPRGKQRRNHMKRTVDENGKVVFSQKRNGKLYNYFEDTPIYPSDVWNDIDSLQAKDKESLGYSEQKPEALLKRIILCSSAPNDIVMDLFSGSGTTASVAQGLGRVFVAQDASPVTLYSLRKRLLIKGGELNLLDSSQKELVFRYPKDNCTADIAFSIVEKRGKRSVIVESASLNGENAPIVYAAMGSVKRSCFYPLHTALSPKLPLKLPLEEGQTVLQVTDSLGHQAFVSVE